MPPHQSDWGSGPLCSSLPAWEGLIGTWMVPAEPLNANVNKGLGWWVNNSRGERKRKLPNPGMWWREKDCAFWKWCEPESPWMQCRQRGKEALGGGLPADSGKDHQGKNSMPMPNTAQQTGGRGVNNQRWHGWVARNPIAMATTETHSLPQGSVRPPVPSIPLDCLQGSGKGEGAPNDHSWASCLFK